MRLVVTGGSGFIGTNAIAHALREGIPVANLDIAAPRNAEQRPVWTQCDVTDSRQVQTAFESFQPTHVLHLAARTDLGEKHSLDGYRSNTNGVRTVVKAVAGRGIQRIVLASSMLVCRNGHSPSGPEDYCPDTLYGESKRIGEAIVRKCDPLRGAWVIVRPTSVWGPWFGPPYRQFFCEVAANRYRHPGASTPRKALSFVGNCVRQLWSLLTSEAAAVHSKVFYLADSPPYTVREWADHISLAIRGRPAASAPLVLFRAAAVAGDGLARIGFHYVPLTTFRLRNMLTASHFEEPVLDRLTGPLPYSVYQGVAQTVEWMRKAGHLPCASSS